jgi:hypothetical protein
MKPAFRAALLATAVAALAPASSWALSGGEGLQGTPHDFTFQTNDFHTAPGTVGICTFCHTPHKAYQTLLLWNHTLSANQFSWDVPTTTAGTTLPTITSSYKGSSVKCLSCHDGSVAVGDVAWFGENSHSTTASAAGTPIATTPNTNITSALAGGAFLVTDGTGNPGNMKGNHPVAVPLPYGQVANAYNSITSGGGLILTDWLPSPNATCTTGPGGTACIRLFQDDGTGNITALAPGTPTASNVGIECSSCHDPHNKQTVDDLFLRGKIAGSTTADGYICLQCHLK